MALCKLCGIEKLSKEFPPVTVSEDCDHPPLECLQCVVNLCKEKNQCPHPGCSISISPDSQTICWFNAILGEMFREYETTYTPPAPIGLKKEVLNITVLNGDAIKIPFLSTMTVADVKCQIDNKLKIPPNKQKLLYHDKEVQLYSSNGKLLSLSENNIPPYATMYLVILLYAIPEAFDHVVFDLHWGFPVSGCDFLDASCLVYQSSNFLQLADYRRNHLPGITHSGDVIDEANRIGHHTINVYLKQIQSNVTHLFFTLSAWNSPNISKYPNPSLKFYEASNMKKDLCKTTFTHAGNSQAVIMCSLSKNTQGRWEIYESGKLSSGNAKNYAPLQSTISKLISSGY